MNKTGIFQHRQGIQELRHEHFDELCTQALELVLFDQFVKVWGEQLENETQMTAMNKRIPKPENVMLVVRIARFV